MELMMDHQSFPKDKPILEFYLLFYKFSLFFHVRKKLEIVALGYMNANFGKMAQETKTIINLHQNLWSSPQQTNHDYPILFQADSKTHLLRLVTTAKC